MKNKMGLRSYLPSALTRVLASLTRRVPPGIENPCLNCCQCGYWTYDPGQMKRHEEEHQYPIV